MSRAIYHVAAVFIEDHEGRLVLQLRDDKTGIAFPGHWGTWGGRVEENETPIEGAVREVQEELMLDVSPNALRYFRSIMLESPAREWHVFFWRAGAAIENAVVMEGQKLGHFSIDEIAAGTLEGRPVHPVLLHLLDEYRIWRERTRTA